MTAIPELEMERHVEQLRKSIENGEGYAFLYEGKTIAIIPGYVVRKGWGDGGTMSKTLIVSQSGRGSIVMDDPNHFNRFVFIQNGFSSGAGDVCTRLVRSLMERIEPVRPALEASRPVVVD